jgi:hypothetical protein
VKKLYVKYPGLEPVLRTLKNPRFCRVSGTGSGRNPDFEKRAPEPVPVKSKFKKKSVQESILWKPKFVKRVLKPVPRNPKF